MVRFVHFHVRSELLYAITSCRICQVLFSKFFKFFLMFAMLRAFAVHRTTFISQHIQLSLSRTFFKFFQTLLGQILFVACRNLISLSQAIPFVKNFFHISANFFVCYLISRGARRQLAYISTSIPICQALFYNFCDSFLFSLTVYGLSLNWYIPV